MSEAVYLPLGDGRYEATGLARGPWSPGHQHGGAPAALVAGAVEALDAPAPMRVARITVEFMRPVPLGELGVETQVVRPGRRVQLVGATVTAGGEEVVRALALRIRVQPGASERQGFGPGPAAGPGEAGDPVAFDREMMGGTMFGGDAMEIRLAGGKERWEEPGPALAWMRLRVPVVAGQEPSALQRAVATADFGNGISSVLDWRRFAFINPDLSVTLGREPAGEWIGLDAVTSISDDGTGMTTGTLFDTTGRFGSSAQALYVSEERG